MRWIKRILIFLLAIAMFGTLVWALLPQPVVVEIAVVQRGAFQQAVEEDGRTRVRERYVVSAPLAGRLQRIGFKAGDRVERGQVLASIVPSAPALLDVRAQRELQERVGAADAERQQAAAEVERAHAALDQAQADLKRSRELVVKRFISATQLEHDELAAKLNDRVLAAAKFADRAAQHRLAEARAALLRWRRETQGSRVDATSWEIRSPVPGRVLKVARESEGDVSPGEPLLELADPADLEAVVDVLTTDAVQIKPGASVIIERYGGSAALEGRVRLVEPAAFTKVSALGVEEQRVNAVIDIISPREQWQEVGDGYRVDVRIVVFSQTDAVKIPVSALFRDGGNWAVFLLSDGRARKRVVEIGRRSGQNATVEKGLEPGEQVVVYPSDKVKDGVRVKVAE